MKNSNKRAQNKLACFAEQKNFGLIGKKISTLLIGILAMMAFTSCDEDVVTAYRLEGEWTGDMGMFYRFADRYNHIWTVDAAYTNIRFFRQGSDYGYGDQVDFYNDGPYLSQSYRFQWRVTNGVIQMFYDYDHDLDCDIYRWSISSEYDSYTRQYRDVFAGYINDRTRFLLFKLADFSWSSYSYNYNNYYGYNYYDNYDYYYQYGYGPYYYGKTRSEASDSTNEKSEIKVVKRGSRFFEQK